MWMYVRIVVLIVMSGFVVPFLWLCVRFANDKIGPNYSVGIRIPAAFKSEEAWYKIHRFCGRMGTVLGIAYLVFVLILFFIPQVSTPVFNRCAADGLGAVALTTALVPAILARWLAR